MKVEECTLCHDFGFRQIYQYGRVYRIVCDCTSGQSRKEKIEEDLKKFKLDRKLYYSRKGEIKDE
jgi:hypothetical protein